MSVSGWVGAATVMAARALGQMARRNGLFRGAELLAA